VFHKQNNIYVGKGERMDLQSEIKYYLNKFGMTRAHMAGTLNIPRSTLSGWLSCRLVLPTYHLTSITKYRDDLKLVEQFLEQNNIVI